MGDGPSSSVSWLHGCMGVPLPGTDKPNVRDLYFFLSPSLRLSRPSATPLQILCNWFLVASMHQNTRKNPCSGSDIRSQGFGYMIRTRRLLPYDLIDSPFFT